MSPGLYIIRDGEKCMNKFVKIGAIVAGVLIVLVVTLSILAKILITPERVRATVLPIAEQALEREVHLGEIEVSLFSGISLRDLRIMEKDEEQAFVSADQVVLRYRFWPLLFLQVVVDEVRLEKPSIRVVRRADGTFNFSDLVESEAAAAPTPTPPAAASADGPAPINLTIATVRLIDGDLLFIDQMITPEAPLRYQISQLNLSADDIALDRAFPFELACRINEAPLSVKGRADVLQQNGRARVELRDFDIMAFAPYFQEQVPGRLDGLRLDLDVEVEGGIHQVSSKGNISLKDIHLVLDDMPEAPLRGANLSVDYDVYADLQASNLDVRSSRVDFNGIVAHASGRITDFAEAPHLAMDVKVPGLDLRKALAALPRELVQDAAEFDPSGTVELTARLEGLADEGAAMLKKAQVVLRDVQANAGDLRPAVNGALDLDGDRLVSRDLILVAGENRARIDLNASNLFGEPIAVNHAVTSERFNLDALLQGTAAPAAAAPAAPATDAPAEEIGPIELPLTVNGTVKIGQTLYKGLTIHDFDLAYKLIDNILTVDK
jgi:AsmA protein